LGRAIGTAAPVMGQCGFGLVLGVCCVFGCSPPDAEANAGAEEAGDDLCPSLTKVQALGGARGIADAEGDVVGTTRDLLGAVGGASADGFTFGVLLAKPLLCGPGDQSVGLLFKPDEDRDAPGVLSHAEPGVVDPHAIGVFEFHDADGSERLFVSDELQAVTCEDVTIAGSVVVFRIPRARLDGFSLFAPETDDAEFDADVVNAACPWTPFRGQDEADLPLDPLPAEGNGTCAFTAPACDDAG
jgi:hypothetical protein